MLILITPFHYYMGEGVGRAWLLQYGKKKERRKAIHMRTEDVKLLLFSAYMNVHIGNPKEYTKWLQKLISEFSKVNTLLNYKKYLLEANKFKIKHLQKC